MRARFKALLGSAQIHIQLDFGFGDAVTPAPTEMGIGRFLAREGCEEALEQAIRKSWAPARAEPGCVRIEWFRSIRNPRLFFVHSRWADEAAFEVHADLPHTVTFIEEAERLIEHPLDVTRIRALDPE